MAQFINWGNGHDGSATGKSGTVNSYAAMTGTAGATTVTTTLSVSVGDQVILHQSRGTANVGKWEIVKVAATGAGSFTADRNLTNTYASVSQAVLVPQYTGGTISGTITGTQWAGTSGGVIALICSGDLVLTGTISVNSYGFTGVNYTGRNTGKQGEGTVAAGGTQSTSANGNGGGGGDGGTDQSGGGGGGNAAAGTTGGTYGGSSPGGTGGTESGVAALTNITFGGAGGTGGLKDTADGNSIGGEGGGIVLIIAKTFTCSSGTISSSGSAGSNTATNSAAGGGGAGGSILIKTEVGTLGTNRITATKGEGGTGSSAGVGGDGAVGRIRIDYKTSYTGSTNDPAISAAQDSSLVIPSGGFFAFM